MPPAVDAQPKSVGDFVEAYETARLRDGYADIPAFLPHPDDPLYLPILIELVRVELEYSWEQRRPRRLEDYRISFPQLFADLRSLQLITFEEFRLRFQAGEKPSPAEYAQRFGVDTHAWPSLPSPRNHAAHAASVPRSQLGLRVTHRVAAQAPLELVGFATRRVFGGDEDALAELCRSDPGSAERLNQATARMPRVGEQFLGFHLQAELGRGAFGRVFLAQQGDLANRWVALKIAPDLWGESQTLAQLQHTHIVPIYSVHEAGPLHAVCMPYFGATTLAHVLHDLRGQAELPESGKDLLHTLDNRKSVTRLTVESIPQRDTEPTEARHPVTVSPRHLVTLPAPACHLEAMTYPQAVLWLAARLADGLAHAHARGILHRDLKPANILLTDDGQPMLLDFNLSADLKQHGAAVAQVGGTLPYMAPEHLEAFRDGQRPVDGRSDVYALGVILFELLTGQHPFPLRRGPLLKTLPEMIADRSRPPPPVRSRNQAVTPAAEAILRRCLEPNPADRYASAEDLRDDLQCQLEHRPLQHTPEPSWRERAAKWRRRHPRLTSAWMVGTVALLLLAGTTAAFLLAYQRQQQREQRLLTLGATDTLLGLQEQWRRTRLGLMRPDAASPQRAEALALARQVFERYGVLDAASWFDGPAVRVLPADQQTTLRALVDELLLHQARLVLQEARTTPDAADRTAHLEQVRRLLAAAGDAEADTPRTLWRLRAELARLTGQDDDARRAEERAAQQPLHDPVDHFLLVAEHLAAGRYRETTPHLEHLRRHTTDYGACLAVAACYQLLRQSEDAERWYQRALLVEPRAWQAYLQRGVMHLERNYFDPALVDFDCVLELCPNQPTALYNRALARFQRGNLDGARDDLTTLLGLAEPPLQAYLLRARVHERQGNGGAARQDHAAALRCTPRDAFEWSARGEARAAREPKEALADLDKSLALFAGNVDAWQSRAHLLADHFGRTEEALKALDQALRLAPEHVPALVGRGVLRGRLGQRAAALEDAQAALARDRQGLTLYQAGCIYALTSRQQPDDRATALRHLAAALQQGFGFEHLDNDHDLDPLRESPEFRRLVEAAIVLRASVRSKTGGR